MTEHSHTISYYWSVKQGQLFTIDAAETSCTVEALPPTFDYLAPGRRMFSSLAGILNTTSNAPTVYQGKETMDGILCDKWTRTLIRNTTTITFTFYWTSAGWNIRGTENGAVPVQYVHKMTNLTIPLASLFSQPFSLL